MRATPLRVCPSTVVNAPPMRNFSSQGCIVRADTKLLAPVPKLIVVSTEPSGLRRITRLAGNPLKEVKPPTSTSLPSVCTVTALTKSSKPLPGSNVTSTEPAVTPTPTRRVMRLRATPLKVVNPPPTMILPAASTASALTNAAAPVPGLKLLSSVPSALSRANRLRATPLNVVKSPPTNTCPFA